MPPEIIIRILIRTERLLSIFLASKEKLWFVHKDTNRDLEMLLRMLAEKGEKETLSYIRHIYLKGM